MFSENQLYCVLDYETYSEADLKRTGAFEYSVHPSTEILCVAWKIGTRETLKTAKTEFFIPGDEATLGSMLGLFSVLATEKFILVAHNALFEQVITKNVLSKLPLATTHGTDRIPPSRWLCTASLAASLALPRKLENAAKALNLPIQKDKEGHRLILKWCKPKKPSKKDPSTRHSDPEEFKKIIQYCKTDVDAETELFLRCPPLSPRERDIWELDQKINLRGFKVDRPLVETVLEMIKKETSVLNGETENLSYGTLLSANQRDGVLAWLEAEGVFLKDLRKKTVETAIEENLASGDAKRMLELRLAISKTSTAKYQAFELRSRHDGRLRDILLYHGASTGRWGGMGVQPQNFPRGNIRNTNQAAEILRDGDLELVRLIYGDPMSVFSSCLRGMIIASPGTTLDVGDYAAIEARVLFWVAKHEFGIEAFTEGRDLYKELASKIFNVSIEMVSSSQRFVGKQATLGCGYSMGAKKFAITCKNLGQEVSDELSEVSIRAYRETHAPVVRLWENINRAAIAATQNRGKRYSINFTSWFVKDGFLFCELPSKRRLAYYGPSVIYESTPWGDKRPVLYHWGVNSLTKKWECQKTYGGRLVENVVQAISRDLMAEAMLRIEKRGDWKIVLSVHDELIAERDLSKKGSNREFLELMAELSPWAKGCPIKVEGWEGDRYRK